MLKSDEKFVIESLAGHYHCPWREGENPPDAYLDLCGRNIAVEITNLFQLVSAGDGQPVSREAQDEPAIKLAEAINEQLSTVFTEQRRAFLILSSPIKNYRKLLPALTKKLNEIALRPDMPIEPIEFQSDGNDVLINLSDEWALGDKRVSAAVINRNSNPDILKNCVATLRNTLLKKAAWSKAKAGNESWLALLNRYDILASADTFKRALQSIDVIHGFNRIVIVSTSRNVATIFTNEIYQVENLRGDGI